MNNVERLHGEERMKHMGEQNMQPGFAVSAKITMKFSPVTVGTDDLPAPSLTAMPQENDAAAYTVSPESGATEGGLSTPGVTEGMETIQPAGEELPTVTASMQTPAATQVATESLAPLSSTLDSPLGDVGNSAGLWGWLIGIAFLLVILAVLVVRLLRKDTSKMRFISKAGSSYARTTPMKPEHGAESNATTVNHLEGRKNMQSIHHAGAVLPAHYRVGYAQTIGKRPNQEDSYGASTSEAQIREKGLLAVVADGIGGMEDGQVASSAVIRAMFNGHAEQSSEISASARLLRLVASAQNSVLEINRNAASRCGSTIVCVLAKGDELSFLSIGDSRIYLLRSGALLQLNREHKFGSGHDENVALGYTGESVDARRRAAITSYIGRENMSQIDRNTQPLRLIHGDRILLMTDGVFGTLSEDELIQCMRCTVQEAAERIIAAVEEKNMTHQDNATVVIVEYL